MKKTMNVQRAVLLLGIFFGLSVFGFNCARTTYDVATQSYDSPSIAPLHHEEENSPVTAKLSYSVLSGEQMLNSLLSMTGQPTPLNGMLTEYNRRIGAFSTAPELGSANSPMMLAITSLSGEVCNEFVQKEAALAAASRMYFGQVNFGAPVSQLTSAQYENALGLLAKAFWNRDLTLEEKNLFGTFRTDFIATVPAAQVTQNAPTRALILSTCTAFLSSFEVYTY